MKLDAKQCAAKIIEKVGGNANIQTVSHCMTRLRFTVKDINNVNTDDIKGITGVLGVVYVNGQLQVIMGQNLLPVYEVVTKLVDLNESVTVEKNSNASEDTLKLTPKSAGSAILGYISASVTPMLPGLIAGGLLKVFLLLITLITSTFAETQTYQLLSMLANAPFYFMPIFVAYGASKKLGATPIYAMLCSASLLAPDFVTLVGSGEAIKLFGISVKAVNYSSSLVPALLISLVAYYSEKIFNKIVPGIFKSILVGLGTIIVTMTLGFTILGPLGSYAGVYLAYVFVWLGNTVGPIAIGVLAACLPWLVMCGMHTALVPFMTQTITDPGYDPVFRPAFMLHNMAEGGACIGVALKTKNAEFRAEAFSIAFGCIVAGVTEPAIYGINLRLRKPMYGVMAGGAAGGLVAGFLGAKAYVMGYSTILALPIFENTMIAMLAAIIVCIVVAAIVTIVLGFEEEDSEQKEPSQQVSVAGKVADNRIVAVSNGIIIPLKNVNDEVFSQKMMGNGIAFELSDDIIASPCNGTLSAVFPTGHAFAVTMDNKTEVLVHIGINTVELNGKGFQTLKEQGKTVTAGEPIIKLDMNLLKDSGYDLTTMLIITDDSGTPIEFKKIGSVCRGDIIN